MDILSKAWIWVLGSLTSILVVCRAVIFKHVRLRSENAGQLIKSLKEEGRAWIVEEELTDDPVPRIFTAYCWLYRTPFRVTIEERGMDMSEDFRRGKKDELSPLGEVDIPTIDELLWVADRISERDYPTARERSIARKVDTFLRIVAENRAGRP